MGSEEAIQELVDEIMQNGIKIGRWKFMYDLDYNDLFFIDLKERGYYKFSKTKAAHVIQGIDDPGPSNGKSINPLALLGAVPANLGL